MGKLVRRIKLWFTKYKDCPHCCLFCEFFEECESDLGKGG